MRSDLEVHHKRLSGSESEGDDETEESLEETLTDSSCELLEQSKDPGDMNKTYDSVIQLEYETECEEEEVLYF